MYSSDVDWIVMVEPGIILLNESVSIRIIGSDKTDSGEPSVMLPEELFPALDSSSSVKRAA